ncbi:unnamed protein product [Rotaria magnacalcarata]
MFIYSILINWKQYSIIVPSSRQYEQFLQSRLVKKMIRFLSSEFFTNKLFANILNYVQQSSSHIFSKLTLTTGAMDA